METCCKGCGRPIEAAPFVVDLDRNLLLIEGQQIRLVPQLAEIAAALMKAYPNVASREFICEQIYGWREWAEPKALDVQISNLRDQLMRSRLRIQSHWGRGFVFILADKTSPKIIKEGGLIDA